MIIFLWNNFGFLFIPMIRIICFSVFCFFLTPLSTSFKMYWQLINIYIWTFFCMYSYRKNKRKFERTYTFMSILELQYCSKNETACLFIFWNVLTQVVWSSNLFFNHTVFRSPSSWNFFRILGNIVFSSVDKSKLDLNFADVLTGWIKFAYYW